MSHKKQRLYTELLDRLKLARDNGYHYEACWFAHSIFEDRTRSIVTNSADGAGHSGKISEKLKTILDRFEETIAQVIDGKPVRDKKSGHKKKKPKWPNLHTFERRLIEDILKWTKDRNDLVHDLASGQLSLTEADALSAQMSELGQNLSKELCTAARHVKKRAKIERTAEVS